MLRSRIIVITMLVLFSFQLLPLKQVGSLIYANRLLEEMPNNSDAETAKFSDEGKNLECLLHHYPELQPALISTDLIRTYNISIHFRNFDDILTPPPNCLG